MSDYIIEINKLSKERKDGTFKTEIWAEITDKLTFRTMNRRIWWKDDEGVFHDGVPDLPIEIRGAVDTAWIEKSKKW